jgi:hypothetical protein
MQQPQAFHEPAGRPRICRFGKRLEDEIYVASEASATPLESYAPQSNSWYPQGRVFTALDFGNLMFRNKKFAMIRASSSFANFGFDRTTRNP